MKQTNHFLVFLGLSLFLFSLNSFAGVFRIGNGGGGIKSAKTDQIYLLDLAEAGLNDSAKINCNKNIFLGQVKFSLPESNFPVDLISCKISEIYQKDKILAFALLKFIQTYEWQFVTEELVLTPDLSTSLNVNPEDLVQLANRRFGQIVINTNHWKKMSRVHQSALVIHEAIYGLINAKHLDHVALYSLARTIIGTLYKDLDQISSSTFKKVTQSLPTVVNLYAFTTSFAVLENSYYVGELPTSLLSPPALLAPSLIISIYRVKYIYPIKAKFGFEVDYQDLHLRICMNSRIDAYATRISAESFVFDLETNQQIFTSTWNFSRKTTAHEVQLDFHKLCVLDDVSQLRELVEKQN
jgi:hypothetical protein